MQMYTTNDLLCHPLVSPIMQPTLGGLPPLLIMVGGGETLRDEQIYLAHKCANPAKYAPAEALMHESAREQLAQFKPTDVQLQVWDDLCHVAPTLSFTRPAKYMYRSIAQFGAWALARAQNTGIDILDDDDISIISQSGSDNDAHEKPTKENFHYPDALHTPTVGRAGDELPPFQDHMIRQQVSRHGIITPLAPEAALAACNMDPNDVGVVKEGPVRKWLATRTQWDNRFGSARAKIHKRRLKGMVAGYEGFHGEVPPPSALAGRRKMGDELTEAKKRKSMGLALWSLWGSKHDEQTVNREQEADKAPEIKVATEAEGSGARTNSDIKKQEKTVEKRKGLLESRSPSRRRIVKDGQQTADNVIAGDAEDATALDILMAKRTGGQQSTGLETAPRNNLLTPDYAPLDTGATGKRPMVDGIAVPFTLNKEAETASMITLSSNMESRVASPRPMSLEVDAAGATGAAAAIAGHGTSNQEPASGTQTPRPTSPPLALVDDMADEEPVTAGTPRATSRAITPAATSPDATPTAEKPNALEATPKVVVGGAVLHEERPPLETFVTAQEELPMAK